MALHCILFRNKRSLLPQIARFMGPTWSPSGADRTQVGPMLAPMNFDIWDVLQHVHIYWVTGLPTVLGLSYDYMISHIFISYEYMWVHIDVLVQNRRNSSAIAMELVFLVLTHWYNSQFSMCWIVLKNHKYMFILGIFHSHRGIWNLPTRKETHWKNIRPMDHGQCF